MGSGNYSRNSLTRGKSDRSAFEIIMDRNEDDLN